jgi:lecithin:retinol acyltransferase
MGVEVEESPMYREQRNANPVPTPPIGAHVTTPRHGYMHHGIYVGAGRVVHYAGYSSGFRVGPVEEVSIEAFADGHPVNWRARTSCFAPDEIVRRARSRLGEDSYRLLRNNCEHFCAWCVDGSSKSEQVEQWLARPRDWLRRWVAGALATMRLRGARGALYSTVPIDSRGRYSTVTLFAKLRG